MKFHVTNPFFRVEMIFLVILEIRVDRFSKGFTRVCISEGKKFKECVNESVKIVFLDGRARE